MLIPDSLKVTPEHGPRPAGKPDECFYCDAPVGEDHKPDCVLRKRVVWVKSTIRYPVLVPSDWDQYAIEFHRNDSSWCYNNMVRELERLVEDGRMSCLCNQVSTEYDREAYDGEFRDWDDSALDTWWRGE